MKKVILFPFAVVFFMFERAGHYIIICWDSIARFIEDAADMAGRWVSKY